MPSSSSSSRPAERPWYRWDGRDLLLRVRVQPRAAREGVDRIHGGLLKVRVTAAPVDGRANAALCRLVAREFGVPPARVALLRGATGVEKQLRIAAPLSLPGWFEALTR
jgi:uncharacterized protein (TIGR00251 family)